MEAMLEHDISESTVKDDMVMSPFIVDMHETSFTLNKGIYIIETTVEDLHKAIADCETSL
eukprot:12583384-Ditylum_brightwellii.AAC.1